MGVLAKLCYIAPYSATWYETIDLLTGSGWRDVIPEYVTDYVSLNQSSE